MSRIFNVVLNLSIGVKLGISSGLVVLLVAGMIASQLRANATARDIDANKLDQQTIARDAVDAKASACRLASVTSGSPVRRQTCRRPMNTSHRA
jgi:hypothetical protein